MRFFKEVEIEKISKVAFNLFVVKAKNEKEIAGCIEFSENKNEKLQNKILESFSKKIDKFNSDSNVIGFITIHYNTDTYTYSISNFTLR